MAAKITNPGTESFVGEREHQGFRLDARILAIIEDLAMGVESGESGLKSCALGAVAASAAGAKSGEVNARHHHEVEIVDDEDECFNRIGDMLAAGFSHEEIAKQVTLGGGATHLLALERYCDRIRLSCDRDAERGSELASFPWRGSALHERRRQGHRAMAALRRTPEGRDHAAVLHIVYGWRDTFVDTLPADIRVALGREFAPLARYTDAVEAKRLAMAKAEATRGATRPGDRYRVDGNFRRMAERDGYTAEVFADLVDLAAYRERVAREERILSSGDGIRYAVAAFPEPMPVHVDGESPAHWEALKEARKARRLEHEAKIDAFITAVKIDANRMLTEASLAFHAAWLAS